MQLDEMHVALASLAVHLLSGETSKKVKEEDGLVDTVPGLHRSHGKRWNEPQVWQLHTKLC